MSPKPNSPMKVPPPKCAFCESDAEFNQGDKLPHCSEHTIKCCGCEGGILFDRNSQQIHPHCAVVGYDNSGKGEPIVCHLQCIRTAWLRACESKNGDTPIAKCRETLNVRCQQERICSKCLELDCPSGLNYCQKCDACFVNPHTEFCPPSDAYPPRDPDLPLECLRCGVDGFHMYCSSCDICTDTAHFKTCSNKRPREVTADDEKRRVSACTRDDSSNAVLPEGKE